MKLHKDRVELSRNVISNPDEFNYNTVLLRDDINLALLGGLNLQDKVLKHVAIYNEDLIERLKYRVERFENKINSLEKLSSNNKFSAINHLDFLSQAEASTDNHLYIDPKNSSISYPDSNRLSIEASSLMPQKSLKTLREIKTISLSSSSDYDYSSTNDGLYNFYIVKSNPTPSEVVAELSLSSAQDINSFYFDHASEFPFNLKKLEYKSSGVWAEISNVEQLGIFAHSRIDFPLVGADGLRITFELPECKVTNRHPDNDLKQLATNLTRDFQEYIDLDEYDQKTLGLYNHFVFHFGIQNIEVAKYDRANTGMHVSKAMEFNEPASFFVQTDYQIEDADLEMYLIKKDYDSNGDLKSTEWLPIIEDGKTYKTGEVILPLNPDEALSVTVGETNYDVLKVAKTSFPVDEAQLITIKENGSPVTNSPVKYKIDGDKIYFLDNGWTVTPGAIYTIDYIPFHINRDFFTPVKNPKDLINKSWTYDYKPEYDVLLDITGSEGNWTISEVISGGAPYIRLMLPNSIDANTLAVERLIDDQTDLSAPVYNLEGAEQNVFLVGRMIYLPFDSSLYPKLTNAKYKISGSLLETGLTEDTLHYYNKDNSIVVNWNAFNKSYGSDYSKTLVHLAVLVRSNSANDSFVKVRDIYLYTSKFKDLIMNPSNIQV